MTADDNSATAAADAEGWAAFRQWMAIAHPQGAQVVDRARAEGCKLSECLGITIDGPANVMGGFPIALFGDRAGEFLMIQPGCVHVCRNELRDGPPVKLPRKS